MAQFDVYQNPNARTRNEFPYLVDVQSDLLSGLTIRVVVPLVRLKSLGQPLSRLNPGFLVKDQDLALATTHIAGVPKTVLGPVVANLAHSRDTIIAAIDVVITGV